MIASLNLRRRPATTEKAYQALRVSSTMQCCLGERREGCSYRVGRSSGSGENGGSSGKMTILPLYYSPCMPKAQRDLIYSIDRVSGNLSIADSREGIDKFRMCRCYEVLVSAILGHFMLLLFFCAWGRLLPATRHVHIIREQTYVRVMFRHSSCDLIMNPGVKHSSYLSCSSSSSS